MDFGFNNHDVRRFTSWYLPLTIALLSGAVFANGLVAFLRGDIGEPVDLQPRAAAITATAPRDIIAPIIVGDSLARGTGDVTGLGIGGRVVGELRTKQHVQSKDIVNIAVNGARAADLLRLLESRNVRTLLAQSNVIIVSIGGNDLWGDGLRNGVPNPERVMAEVLGRVETCVKTIRQASPNARIYVIGLYNPFGTTPRGQMLTPFVNRWNARLIERFESDGKLTVVQTSDIFAFHDRLSADRFHPSSEAYAIIAERIAESL